jgi:hypothetical protein
MLIINWGVETACVLRGLDCAFRFIRRSPSTTLAKALTRTGAFSRSVRTDLGTPRSCAAFAPESARLHDATGGRRCSPRVRSPHARSERYGPHSYQGFDSRRLSSAVHLPERAWRVRRWSFGRRSRSHDLSWTRNGTDRESLKLTRTVITPDRRPGKWLEAVVQNDGPLPGQSNARRHEPVSQAHSRWIVGDLGLPGKQNFPD